MSEKDQEFQVQERKRLRKQAFVFCVVYSIVWISEVILDLIFDLPFLQMGEAFGLFQFIFSRCIGFYWTIKNARTLEIDALTWSLFCFFSPILTSYLIGISKDKVAELDL